MCIHWQGTFLLALRLPHTAICELILRNWFLVLICIDFRPLWRTPTVNRTIKGVMVRNWPRPIAKFVFCCAESNHLRPSPIVWPPKKRVWLLKSLNCGHIEQHWNAHNQRTLGRKLGKGDSAPYYFSTVKTVTSLPHWNLKGNQDFTFTSSTSSSASNNIDMEEENDAETSNGFGSDDSTENSTPKCEHSIGFLQLYWRIYRIDSESLGANWNLRWHEFIEIGLRKHK